MQIPLPDYLFKLTGYILVCFIAHWPANAFIRRMIGGWKPPEESSEVRMGAFIGTLERILIILLIGLESYTGVGFVITMKSIARYERMKEKDFAEYFLAGTMLSVLIAMLLGLIVQRTLGKI